MSSTSTTSSSANASSSLLSGAMVASSSDWVGYNNPTGWGYPPEYINVGAHGLVGHCWKALTITTTYDAPKTVTGIQTDSVKPFSIEHSSDGGSTWVLVGNDFNGSVTDLHIGYEGDLGESAGYYLQAGPAIVAVDGEENETEISGKAGLGIDVTDQVNVYGEVSFLTLEQQLGDDLGVGVKAGVKYSF